MADSHKETNYIRVLTVSTVNESTCIDVNDDNNVALMGSNAPTLTARLRMCVDASMLKNFPTYLKRKIFGNKRD